MKLPTLPKLPKLPKLPMVRLSRPKPPVKRLQATARRAAQPMLDDYDEEPTTRLSSAFIVVLILHVVAVGGIYAFNSIKAQRRSGDPGTESTASSAAPTASASTTAPAAPVTEAVRPASPPTMPSNLVAPVSGARIHRVQSGETLSQLAVLYSLSLSELAQANGLDTDAKLRVDQALNIPIANATPTTAKAAAPEVKKVETTPKPSTPAKSQSASTAKTYTVVKGDNPVSIARRFGVSYEALLKLNKITDPRRLRIGQELAIPAKGN